MKICAHCKYWKPQRDVCGYGRCTNSTTVGTRAKAGQGLFTLYTLACENWSATVKTCATCKHGERQGGAYGRCASISTRIQLGREVVTLYDFGCNNWEERKEAP